MTIDLPSQPGTYCLVLHCLSSSSVTIGKLGMYQINPDYYCYIGSAFGRGGLHSRLNRHLQIDKSQHWHLDYLRPYLNPVKIYYSTNIIKQEHQWAELLLQHKKYSIPINKFGSSDCRCSSHLFYYQLKPKLKTFFGQCTTIKLET